MSQIRVCLDYPGVTAELLADNDDGTALVRLIDVGDWRWEGPSSGDEHTVELSRWPEQKS